MAMELNKSQERAVKHEKGPLLIIAGAGTGKTRVITERIKYLIESGKAKPSEILALTFTEKASREMSDRVDAGLPIGHEEIWISTFHSFCERLLRQDGLEIGLDTSYRILTEPELWLFVRQNLFKFQAGSLPAAVKSGPVHPCPAEGHLQGQGRGYHSREIFEMGRGQS